MSVNELVKATGKSRATIYLMAKRLGRLPTKEEVLAVKMGRPKKY